MGGDNSLTGNKQSDQARLVSDSGYWAKQGAARDEYFKELNKNGWSGIPAKDMPSGFGNLQLVDGSGAYEVKWPGGAQAPPVEAPVDTSVKSAAKVELPSWYKGESSATVTASKGDLLASVKAGEIGEAKEGSDVKATPGSKVHVEAGAKVEAQAGAEVIAEDGAEVVAQLGSKVYASSGAHVMAAVGTDVYASPGTDVKFTTDFVGDHFRSRAGQENYFNSPNGGGTVEVDPDSKAVIGKGFVAHAEPGSSVNAMDGGGVLAEPGSKVNVEMANWRDHQGIAQAADSFAVVKPGATVVAAKDARIATADANVPFDNFSPQNVNAGDHFYGDGAKISGGTEVVMETTASNRVEGRGVTATALEGSTVSVAGGGSVIAEGGSRILAGWTGNVDALAGSRVEARDGSQVKAENGSSVEAFSGAHVTAEKGSSVRAYRGSVVQDHGGSIQWLDGAQMER